MTNIDAKNGEKLNFYEILKRTVFYDKETDTVFPREFRNDLSRTERHLFLFACMFRWVEKYVRGKKPYFILNLNNIESRVFSQVSKGTMNYSAVISFFDHVCPDLLFGPNELDVYAGHHVLCNELKLFGHGLQFNNDNILKPAREDILHSKEPWKSGHYPDGVLPLVYFEYPTVIHFLVTGGVNAGKVVCMYEEAPFLEVFTEDLNYLYYLNQIILSTTVTYWLDEGVDLGFLGEFSSIFEYNVSFDNKRTSF